jgi:hypothetical protein
VGRAWSGQAGVERGQGGTGQGGGRARVGRGQGGAERVGHGRGGRGRGGTGHVEEMREREAGERKGGPNILAYIRWADTSTDEHKRAGLRCDCDALCLSATQRT